MMAAPTSPMRVFGVDLGSQRCVVAESSGDVVLNELGGMTTATLVAFKGHERLIGEAAVLSSNTNPRNTVDYVNLLLGRSLDEAQPRLKQLPGQRVRLMDNAQGGISALVEYRGKEEQFTAAQLAAMLLGKLTVQLKKRMREDEGFHVNIAVPSSWNESQKRALKRAARIAGIPRMSVLPRDVALARCFHRKHPYEPVDGESEGKHIVIMDMGHTSTSVALVKLTAEGETVLAMDCNASLGSEDFDLRMMEYFQTEIRTKHNVNVELHSKEGKRLLHSCEKLKKLLSTIGEASVTVENIGQDKDITIKLSRDHFEKLCVQEKTQVKQLLDSVLRATDMPVSSIVSVEIVGGGTRIPFVQDLIQQVFTGASPSHGGSVIGRMMDSTTSVAVGAAYCGHDGDHLADMEDIDSDSSEEIAELEKLIAVEREMQDIDTQIAAIAQERNAIEAFIYEMRSKPSAKYGDKIDSSKLNPLLDSAEDWIYSEEAEVANLEQMKSKCQEIKAAAHECCKEYFEAVDADEKKLEAELEAEAKKAADEKMAEGGDEDHDTRKLKKPERMRLVTKNKEEGNELFRDGNHQHAAMRYIKALQHASKFFDLSDADQEEVNKIRVSLYLNLAQCYLKMESWSKVIANCRDAISLDPKNPKAYYRRALAYEKEKDIDKAVEDVNAALAIVPDDKAIQKLDERLKVIKKRQVEKEKKMWSRAFA